MKEPNLRFVTNKAIEELTKGLNLIYDLDDYQDWEYIVGKPADVEKYINYYNSEINDDCKFALMEIIIQTIEDQEKKSDFLKYLEITQKILSINFKIHEYSIFYWCCFDNENLEDCWKVTPYLRTLWEKNSINNMS
ncbi:hypothetical protein [Empedobacter tilapiae]|uniref:Uncharacterized protein n=1 Tax=Empedobacter tilapiae TaxID=2491114 RepID=A0A4Z1BLU8_9FLAO|nr:hypothetical protein [Empedobacter tilapiae]TGN23085.1 hypothetical protein E4J94_15190 [Empedobacter tilapiae]